jgi:hypothetical protein
MHYEEFIKSLSGTQLPENLDPILSALWYDGKENWNMSHEIAQEIHDNNGSWIHAYLHRKEGDISNARYWYSMAGKPVPKVSLKEEWESLVHHFLK